MLTATSQFARRSACVAAALAMSIATAVAAPPVGAADDDGDAAVFGLTAVTVSWRARVLSSGVTLRLYALNGERLRLLRELPVVEGVSDYRTQELVPRGQATVFELSYVLADGREVVLGAVSYRTGLDDAHGLSWQLDHRPSADRETASLVVPPISWWRQRGGSSPAVADGGRGPEPPVPRRLGSVS